MNCAAAGYSEEAVADIAGRNFLNYYRRLGWTE